MKMAIELTFENVYLVLMAALVTSHMSHSKLLRELTFEKVYRVLITAKKKSKKNGYRADV